MLLAITTAPADLAHLYPWLDEAVKDDALPAKLLQNMHVALDEVVSNVVLHAFAPGDDERLTVEYITASETVTLVISDTGQPFDPIDAPSPARPTRIEDAPTGGNGLLLLRHFCKDISYRRAEGQNQLTLRFPRKA